MTNILIYPTFFQPDYDDIEEDENRLGMKNFPSSRGTSNKTKDKKYGKLKMKIYFVSH